MTGRPSADSAFGSYKPEKHKKNVLHLTLHLIFAAGYLCYFISGVPFDSEKDLGKDLRDVHAVVPGRRRERGQLLCFYTYSCIQG